jgi:hypothetical protein
MQCNTLLVECRGWIEQREAVNLTRDWKTGAHRGVHTESNRVIFLGLKGFSEGKAPRFQVLKRLK